jgi:hypothetical protein
MKHTIKIIGIAAVMLGLAACVNDLDVKPIDPNVKVDFDQTAVFAKIYGTLGLTGQVGPNDDGDIDGMDEGASSFYRMMWELNEFPSDEVWWVWADAGIPDIRAMSWSTSNDLVKGLYYRLYFDITLCNLFLENTEGLNDGNTVKQRAEVRFIRALNYYYLLDMYVSGVPFAQKTGAIPEPISKSNLYAWLVGELKNIEPDLYEAGAKPNYYRVDKAAAWLLLARTYLNAKVYTGTADWDSAALYAGKVMTSSYTLAPTYKHLFMGDNDNLSTVNTASREIILPIAQDGIETQSYGASMFLIVAMRVAGMNYAGTSDNWECARAKSNLVQKFFLAGTNILADENSFPTWAQDDRCLLVNQVKDAEGKVTYEATTAGGGKNGSDAFKAGWGIAKFTNVAADPNIEPRNVQFPDMDVPYLRLAEAYLTYAEAVFRGGAAANGTALDAVNALRRRAHASEWDAAYLTEGHLLDEWSREFYAEGRRRSDLIRHNKFAGNVNYNWEGKGGVSTGKNVDVKYNYYPIPNSDIVANNKLTQDPAYQ